MRPQKTVDIIDKVSCSRCLHDRKQFEGNCSARISNIRAEQTQEKANIFTDHAARLLPPALQEAANVAIGSGVMRFNAHEIGNNLAARYICAAYTIKTTQTLQQMREELRRTRRASIGGMSASGKGG